MSGWPDVIQCENSSCGRKIHTKTDKFTVVTYSGNVSFNHAGHKRNGNCSYAICDRCTRGAISKMKRKNKLLDGVIMKAAAIIAMVLMLFVSGCSLGPSINEELAQRNKGSVDQIVKDNNDMRGWLKKSVDGDNSWNKDAHGKPLFDDNVSKAMAVRNDAATKTADEIVANSKPNTTNK